MSKDKTSLPISIITPAHNEEKIIRKFISSADKFLKAEKISGEIIVVENGSSDKTAKILKDLQKKYRKLRVENLKVGDKGKALKRGLDIAKGEYLITLDTDLWDEKFVKESIKYLEDYDVVVGSKTMEGAKDDRPLGARLMNIGYNFFFKLLFNFQGTETHAKLSFKRDKILPLAKKCKSSGLVFDTELVLRAEKAKLKKLEIPTHIKEVRPRTFSPLKQLSRVVGDFILLLKTLGPSPNWVFITLFISLALGFFLRFYRFKELFYFALDEEHYAFMTRMITINHHFPAIGGPVSGTDLYLSPLYLYLNAIPYLFSGNNPLVSGAITTFLGVIAIFLLYKMGSNFFSKRVGIIAAFLSAVSMLVVISDRHSWNISLTYFIALLTIYGIWKIKNGQQRWILYLWIALTIGISAHFSNAAALIFAILAWIIFRLPVRNRYFVAGLLIFILAHLPLVYFDLRHNFWETRAAIKFFTQHDFESLPLPIKLENTASLAAYSFSRAVYIGGATDLNEEYNLCQNIYLTKVNPPFWAYIIVGITFIAFLVFSFKALFKNNSLVFKLFYLMILVNVAFLAVFRVDPAERHFLPSLGIFFISLALLIDWLMKKQILRYLMLILILGLAYLNIDAFLHSYAAYGFADKEKAVETAIAMSNGQPFYFLSLGDCHMWGYRYLFSMLGDQPAASYIDSSLSWTYDKQPTDNYNQEIIFYNPMIHKPWNDTNINNVKQEFAPLLLAKPAKVGNIEIWLTSRKK